MTHRRSNRCILFRGRNDAAARRPDSCAAGVTYQDHTSLVPGRHDDLGHVVIVWVLGAEFEEPVHWCSQARKFPAEAFPDVASFWTQATRGGGM